MTTTTRTRPAGRWRRHIAIGAILLGVAALGVSAAMAQTTIRLAHVNPADWRISQKGAAGDVFRRPGQGGERRAPRSLGYR